MSLNKPPLITSGQINYINSIDNINMIYYLVILVILFIMLWNSMNGLGTHYKKAKTKCRRKNDK